MTPEDQKYYETYFDLFNTEGWSQLIKQVEIDKNNFEIEGIENERHLFQTQGQIFILNTLLNMEDSVRAAYDSIIIQENTTDYDT